MRSFEYIERFQNLGFGLFVHFGLYSIVGKGEWHFWHDSGADKATYEQLPSKFRVAPNWAKRLVSAAKSAGARYITLTTRHHDGFSLYDTRGLNEYDAPHSACGRDLIKEFVEACREADIVPFFYHTLLDWHNEDYQNNFPRYIDYLIESVKILCTNYGPIGGLWFDGMWDKPNGDWQLDRLYGTIRSLQPEAMIINNTGLSELGKVGHYEIDSVTFERGKPNPTDCSDRPRAGEVCDGLNDHWGYTRDDLNYKSVKELIYELIDCRKYNANFLLNTGLCGNGTVNPTDKGLILEVGKWIHRNKKFIYKVRGADISAENADVLQDGKSLYVIVKDVGMIANVNAARAKEIVQIKLNTSRPIKKAVWLDNGQSIPIADNSFDAEPFPYGCSLCARVAKIDLG